MKGRPQDRSLLVTDHVLLGVLRALSADQPVCKLSTRQLAELSGIGRKTVSHSLSRLVAARRIEKVKEGSGNHPAHWRVRGGGIKAEIPSVPLARNDPGQNMPGGLHDTFRRRDLRGPGALYRELPAEGAFTAAEVLTNTPLTQRIRTIEHWLLILASLPTPLVEFVESVEGNELWRRIPATDAALQENADALLALGGSSPLVPRSQVQLRHQLERVSRMFPQVTAA